MTSRMVLNRSFAALFGALTVAFMAGCTETNTEYVDVPVERPAFNPPPDSVNGFMGYYTADTKQTTCGNCHVSYQGSWVTTKHAGAYADLVNSGHAASYCYGCHTVSGYGNSIALGPDSMTAGYNAVASPAYHDVQCESCHGPGYTHVSSPASNNHPLAHAGIYGKTSTGGKDTTASCGGCHSGEHEPFTEQWSQTGHADSAANASQAANASCQGCHEGRSALARFNGEASAYIEKDSVGQTTTLPPATCAVCHDPHGSPYEGQLRRPIDALDPDLNLCMSCHNRGTTPSNSFTNSTATTTSRGAHAAQGPILLGSGAGYIPQGFVYDSSAAFTSHASTNNPRLCAGCHVNRFTVTDSSGFVFQSVGHLFSPDPCLDPVTGIPVRDNSCAYTPSSTRNWSGCVNAGCHASADVASSALISERQQIATLANILWTDNNPAVNTGGEPYMDAADAGYLPKLLFVSGNPLGTGAEATYQAFLGTDNHVSPAEGALFNVMMLAENLYGHKDGSYGAHNPFYYEALLSASISAVVAAYPTYLPAPPANVQAIMDKALSRPGVYYNRATGQLKLSSSIR
jgi:predicted CXXCH cytochrome family protein